MTVVIDLQNLEKRFGDVPAVAGVSLQIRQGEVFGLLGPNGAGKTTTISMLATLLAPSGGRATVAGWDVVTQRDQVRKAIGIVFQDPSLDVELTGRENLDLHARLYRIPDKRARMQEVLRLVELEDKADLLVKKYSGGMKRRLEIARGLLHAPHVLFLDEPTLGLDPQTRRKVWDYIRKLAREQEITLILTTHYMDEADELCDRIAIIDRGKIIALGTPRELKGVLGGDVITITSPASGKLLSLLKKKGMRVQQIEGGKLLVTVKDGGTSLPAVIKLAHRHRVPISSVGLKRPSLEDVFIHYTGRTIREQEADSKEGFRQYQKMTVHR